MSGLKTLFRTALTDTWVVDSNGVNPGDNAGDIRWENNKAYKCVIYDEGAETLDVVANDVVYYDGMAGVTNNRVTADISDTQDIGAGIIMATITVTTTFCWIHIKGGEVTLNTTLTAGTTDGDSLTARGANNKTLDLPTAVDDPICAYCIDDSTDLILPDFPF